MKSQVVREVAERLDIPETKVWNLVTAGRLDIHYSSGPNGEEIILFKLGK